MYDLSSLKEALENRDREFPMRGPASEELDIALEKFCEHILREYDNKPIHINEEVSRRLEEFFKNPIFVCGQMKSGTTMTAQLFDVPEKIQVMPGDSRYIRRWKEFNRMSFEELALYWIKRMVNPRGQKPFWCLGRSEDDYLEFARYLHHFREEAHKESFQAVLMAIFCLKADKDNFRPKYWLEKTTSNEFYIDRILKHHPQAKFIHVVRNPFSNINSLKSLDNKRGKKFDIWGRVIKIKKSYQSAISNYKTLGKDRYVIVKYEKLTSETRETVIDICERLKIDFSEEMTRPSVCGQPAFSNSMFNEDKPEKAGVIADKSRDERWREGLNKKEKSIIASVLKPEYQALGYDPDIGGEEEGSYWYSLLYWLAKIKKRFN